MGGKAGELDVKFARHSHTSKSEQEFSGRISGLSVFSFYCILPRTLSTSIKLLRQSSSHFYRTQPCKLGEIRDLRE